ncbi:MAG: ABC-F family ATP-binding cassette domain-containing protein [Verrucomicrobiota bacterium]
MLAVDNVTVQFGGRTLFRDLSFVVGAKDRISFAGPNGAGKSTLLKIIAGLNSADGGEITKAKFIHIGYLPQDGVRAEGKSLFEEAETAFADALALQEQLEEANEQLGKLETDSEEYADALEVFGELQLRLEHHAVDRMKPRIERVLAGLGFANSDFGRPVEHFSGGWQMRIALAKLLLAEPNVLLLDEPTNHLDIESQLWLENHLREYNGAVILVSHDRAFLDALISRTFAFEYGKVDEYSGNYSFYLRESVDRREQLKRAYANQQREIDKTQRFIDRFRSKNTKASQVQSRIKQLEKMERIEVGPEAPDGISFQFPAAKRSGQTVAEFTNATKAYGDHVVFSDFDFRIDRGERIAIVGVNGAGKSTFSRALSGAEPLTDGTAKLGHNVESAHFEQDHAESLDASKTVLETVQEAAARSAQDNLRTLLGCFLFRGDDVFKSVSVLSGGERSRLALARMLLSPANFLILDEPTNHLDMQSQGMLQQALKDWEGTYVIVSHNRSFLDPVTDKVLEFYATGAAPRVFPGNVSDYLDKKAMEANEESAFAHTKTAPANTATATSSGKNRKEQRKAEAEARRLRAEKLKPLRAAFAKAEEEVETLEKRKDELEKLLMDPELFRDPERGTAAQKKHTEVESNLERAYTRWSDLSAEIEEVEQTAEQV